MLVFLYNFENENSASPALLFLVCLQAPNSSHENKKYWHNNQDLFKKIKNTFQTMPLENKKELKKLTKIFINFNTNDSDLISCLCFNKKFKENAPIKDKVYYFVQSLVSHIYASDVLGYDTVRIDKKDNQLITKQDLLNPKFQEEFSRYIQNAKNINNLLQ